MFECTHIAVHLFSLIYSTTVEGLVIRILIYSFKFFLLKKIPKQILEIEKKFLMKHLQKLIFYIAEMYVRLAFILSA